MTVKFAAAGDMLLQRRIPESPEVSAIRSWLSWADGRYFNLETGVHREGECYGNVFSGGSYLRVNPELLEDCKRYGFNMTTLCNNHSLDFCFEGLLKTREHVEASGLVHTGTGSNLDQAAAPAYLDTPNGRIALIGFTSSVNDRFDDMGIAGQQSRRTPGRPGVNQLRFKTVSVVTQEQMDVIQAIARDTHFNAAEDIGRLEGYRAPLEPGQFKYGREVEFRVGETTHKETSCFPQDLQRLEKAIFEAKLVSDHIVVALHSHQLDGTAKEHISQFMQEFAHKAIDLGADAVVGHGPHLLRPMELYKGKPIFYSLGDFVLQNENIPFGPEELYAGQGLSSDATMHDVFAARSKNFTRGLQTDRRMFESVLPRWEFRDGKLTKLELLAIELGFGQGRAHGGNPAPAKDGAILERLAEMSKPYGVEMTVSGNVATVKV